MGRQEVSLKDAVEFADNPETRCPCLLLLDTSGSMNGERIEALKAGLQTLHDDLVRDTVAARRIEVAIVTFNSQVRVVQDFVTVDKFQTPSLTASGETHMAAGIECALDMIEARKKTYRENHVSYYRPWVFMITDGQPEGEREEDVTRAANRLRTDEEAKRVAFFAVGVSGADVRRLSHIAVRTPLELEGLDFQGLFLWLSASMQAVSLSAPGDRVTLPPPGWIKRIAMFVVDNEMEIKAAVRVGKALIGLP